MRDIFNNRENINAFWWLWLPAGSLVIFLLIEIFLPSQYYGYLVSENGIVEILQALIMAVGAALALINLRRVNRRKQRWLSAWFGVALLGCIYVTGEEISWGQHLLGWGTPEYWQAINDQRETNLHNVSSWLDQKPRLLMEIGVILGGLILPALLRRTPEAFPHWLKIIAPPATLGITAAAFLFVKIFDKIGDYSNFRLFGRPSEITEFYIFYFIVLYLWAMHRRLAAS